MRTTASVLIFLILFSSAALFAADAPVVMAVNVINAIPGTPSIAIPVTVNNFTNIGQFTLTMKFDTTKVRFISASPNSMLPGMTVTYFSPVGNTQGKILFEWTGASNVSLPDGASLASLTYSYNTGTAILSWAYSYGSTCQYKRFVGGVLTMLNDTPQYLFYKNGGISTRGAPVTYAPAIAVPATGIVPVPVTVNKFNGIGALTLYLEYDPTVITYQNTFTKNDAFGSSFQVGDNPGADGKMLIVIQWYGNLVTLPDGATLCTLNFLYTSANNAGCMLTWFDNGPSCEYADGTTVLIDLPTADFLHNGFAGQPVGADFMAGDLAPLKTETVQLTDLSTGGVTSWHWSFDRPGVVFLSGTTTETQNPQVKFTDGGLYGVSLSTGNGYFTDNETKTGYIRAGIHGLWTGNTSSDWNVLSNWDNYLVPDSITDVVVPSSAAYWPVFDGDLTIGIHCSNLILSGTTSQMTVTGNLTVP